MVLLCEVVHGVSCDENTLNVPLILLNFRSTDPGLVRSRWGDVSTALNARKVQLLSPLVTLVREEMGVECDTSTLVELTEDIHIAIATN